MLHVTKELIERLCTDNERARIELVDVVSLEQLTLIFHEITPEDVGFRAVDFAQNLRELVSVTRSNIVQRRIDSSLPYVSSVTDFIDSNSGFFIRFFDQHELSRTRSNADWNEVVSSWWDSFWEPVNDSGLSIVHHERVIEIVSEIARNCSSELCIESAFLGIDYSAVVTKERAVDSLRKLSTIPKIRDRTLNRISWIQGHRA